MWTMLHDLNFVYVLWTYFNCGLWGLCVKCVLLYYCVFKPKRVKINGDNFSGLKSIAQKHISKTTDIYVGPASVPIYRQFPLRSGRYLKSSLLR